MQRCSQFDAAAVVLILVFFDNYFYDYFMYYFQCKRTTVIGFAVVDPQLE